MMKTINAGQPNARELITEAIEDNGCCVVHTDHEVLVVDEESLAAACEYALIDDAVSEHESDDNAWFYELDGRAAGTAGNLAELRDALRACASCDDLDGLPTFGGEEPSDTTGVWSWDEAHLLVGTCWEDLEIIPR